MLATQLQAKHQQSLLMRCDPRVNMLAAGVFTLFALLLQQVLPLLLMLVLGGLLNLVSGTQWRSMLTRLLAFETFMLLLVLMLPFSVAGDTWFSVAGVDASIQGATQALAIWLRGNAVVLALLALLAIREPINLGYGAAALGFPVKLIHLFMMTVRYIQVLGEEFQRLRNAMKARAFTPASNWHTWRSYGWLMGMLLVRSMERAQRIVDAMRCRGFDGSLYLRSQLRWQRSDSLLLLGLSLISLLPLLWQLFGE
ncbi:cobalt ECF transporter T component CbiQ [Shewanella avicenniae]|uniref:Cobalt ECF transporter T component CbiQ n=1 Tax=Shewanella avicenniae TaxID=2814294 RepID=A0ABX7QUN5_9GAMM|nr:cobalt ECF transporter T component CbiQ [Shewanella avicenniae]QSX34984.1 cobalt ECF transporter T component CbiQ [Shewanella avicenniae]